MRSRIRKEWRVKDSADQKGTIKEAVFIESFRSLVFFIYTRRRRSGPPLSLTGRWRRRRVSHQQDDEGKRCRRRHFLVREINFIQRILNQLQLVSLLRALTITFVFFLRSILITYHKGALIPVKGLLAMNRNFKYFQHNCSVEISEITGNNNR